MNISVCIITRNEAAYLDKCLKALINYPFEIVVTDTGSTDESIDVAGKYTDKIYTYKWNDDFSAARNFCASKASNDMIMMVDTDEFARAFDFEKLMDIIEHNSGMVGRVHLNNIYTARVRGQSHLLQSGRYRLLHSQLARRGVNRYSAVSGH